MSIKKKLKSVEKFPMRAVTAMDLFKINHRSFHVFDYNQSIKPEYLMYLIRHIASVRNQIASPYTILVLGKILIHEHRAGEKCEPHVRTTIYFPKDGRIGFPLIDVSLADFDALLVGETVQRYGYPKEHLFQGMPDVESEFIDLLKMSDRELQNRFTILDLQSASV